MEIGNGDLGRGYQPQVILVVMVKVVRELGQVPGAFHDLPTHQDREQHLGVAVLGGVEVQHPGDEGPLQLGAGAGKNIEAAAGELHSPLEVYNSQLLAQLPMGPGWEGQSHRLSPISRHHIALFVQTRRHVGSGQVGQS